MLVLALITAFPKSQTASSISRMTGLTRKTVAASLKSLEQAGTPRLSWFQAKVLPEAFKKDPIKHEFNVFCKEYSIEQPQRKRLLRAMRFFGVKEFRSIAARAMEKHKPERGTWVQLFNYLLNQRCDVVKPLRDQEKASLEMGRAMERERVARAMEKEMAAAKATMAPAEAVDGEADQDTFIARLLAM